MRIKIAERLHPFSHVPGIFCVIPKSLEIVQIFPALIKSSHREIPLPVIGPVKNFTVLVDLEKGRIEVFGDTANGFMRYFISAQKEGIAVHFEKFPEKFANILIPFEIKVGNIPTERLSLGMHRSQEWEMVCRRADFGEIFPVWLRLSQTLPTFDAKGTSSLVKQTEESKNDKNAILEAFLKLFLAHFHGILTPRLFDDQFQGLVEKTPEGIYPFYFLKEGGNLIRSLFIEETETAVAILPALPTPMHAGRFTDVLLENGTTLDMEWSKKLIRRLIIRPSQDQTILLKFQKPIENFRLRTSLQDKGKILQKNEPITLKAGQTLYLDRFQK